MKIGGAHFAPLFFVYRSIFMEYITLKNSVCEEFIEKRSRFLGYAAPVTSEQEALDFIEAIRAKHRDATHNVYAYRVREGNLCRYSDDGEPSGTAGMPVLSVLTKGDIIDAAIVVTRYFGGILLGGGGLVRAYSHSAAIAVSAAVPVTMRECAICQAVCDYSTYGRMASLIPEEGAVLDDTEFTDSVKLRFHIDKNLLDAFCARVTDVTCGTVAVESSSTMFFPFENI